MSNEEEGKVMVDKKPKRTARYGEIFVPNRNGTEYPDTPKTEDECKQIIYAIHLWILQHDMGLTFEDAQILLCNERCYELSRILENRGLEEDSPDYDEKYELTRYYYETLKEKYEAELKKRSKRFNYSAFMGDIYARFGTCRY